MNMYGEDQRMKMNPQVMHSHQNEKVPCSCPMCPMNDKQKIVKPMEQPLINPGISQQHILLQPHNNNHNHQPMKIMPPQQQQPQQPSTTNLSCRVCHKKIRNSKKHQQAAARTPNYCPMCDKCNRSQKNLYNHNNSSAASNNYGQQQQQHSHHSLHQQQSVYHGQFSSHSVNDSVLSAHSCKICKKGFAFKHDLDRHAKASRGECGKQFRCSKCDKYFSNGGNLKRHLMIHTGEKPYTCHVCNKAFRSKTLLANHIRTHTGEKPFLCHLCDKKFSKSENLKRHVKIHVKHNLA